MESFDSLFDRQSVTDDRKTGETYAVSGTVAFDDIDARGRKRKVRHHISGFVCSETHGQYQSFYARPTAELIERVCGRLLALDRDSIYFKAIRFPDRVDLYAQNNLILNSGPPIAVIDPATFPAPSTD